jgi:hypothetical protein
MPADCVIFSLWAFILIMSLVHMTITILLSDYGRRALFLSAALWIVNFSTLTRAICRLLAESKSAKQAMREASIFVFIS